MSQRRDFELSSPIRTFLTNNLLRHVDTSHKIIFPPHSADRIPSWYTTLHNFLSLVSFRSLFFFPFFAKASSTVRKHKTVREAARCFSLSILTSMRHGQGFFFKGLFPHYVPNKFELCYHEYEFSSLLLTRSVYGILRVQL